MMYDIWKALAGVVIFMLGMKFLEDSLRTLTGRSAKLFLRKQTVNPLRAIAGGAVVTGLVQSSSVVNLVVLGLVGAGTIPMSNALAVILGTNIGTTLNSWIIAGVGFRVNIEQLALPAVAIAGILMTAFPGKSRLYHWLGFLLGFGFLFLGLDMIRTGMEHTLSELDLSSFQHYPVVVFLCIGLVITFLTQSSAATVAIVLSALHANALSLYIGTAVVLGSEVGTTLKLVIAASGEEPAMKRVAFGNLVFNIGTTVVIFIFLRPVNYFIVQLVGIRDPLIALAFFQTLVNLVSVLLFLPLLGRLATFLERRFVDVKKETRFIGSVPGDDGELAVEALEKEAMYFLETVILYCAKAFDLDNTLPFYKEIPEDVFEMSSAERYNFIKHLHGHIYAYYVTLHDAVQTGGRKAAPERIMAAVRNAMYAAKCIKDAAPDIAQLRNSGKDAKYHYYLRAREKAGNLLEQMAVLFDHSAGNGHFEAMVHIDQLVRAGYNNTLSELYQTAPATVFSEMEISTIINFNHEMYGAFKSLVLTLKDLLLTKDEASYFDDLPGFIR